MNTFGNTVRIYDFGIKFFFYINQTDISEKLDVFLFVCFVFFTVLCSTLKEQLDILENVLHF